jgi:hypothetical protein
MKNSSKSQNLANASAKNSIPSKSKNDASLKENLKSINLDAFKNQLDALQLKGKKERENLYIYPESLSKEDIKGEKGKKFRGGLRNKRDRFINNILHSAKIYNADKKKENLESLQNCISLWKDFYKSSYRINDFSIDSISQSKDDEKNKNIIIALGIIKSSLK